VNLAEQAASRFELEVESSGAPHGCDDIRQRILDAARTCYAESDYADTGLGAVASCAGFTVDTVLEHFGGTVDLYVGVLRHVETVFCQHLRVIAAREEGFVAAVGAMLDEIVRLGAVDPTLIRFLTTAAVEVSRHRGRRGAVGQPWFGQEKVYRELVAAAVAACEVDAEDRELMVGIIIATTVGLMATVNPEAQRPVPLKGSSLCWGGRRSSLFHRPHPDEGGSARSVGATVTRGWGRGSWGRPP
jgi:AcrR family transcriptional regulator